MLELGVCRRVVGRQHAVERVECVVELRNGVERGGNRVERGTWLLFVEFGESLLSVDERRTERL